jgi:hypothetical protein
MLVRLRMVMLGVSFNSIGCKDGVLHCRTESVHCKYSKTSSNAGDTFLDSCTFGESALDELNIK